MSTSGAAKALRDSFGDRKLPDISRKITACVACRKLKIKCHMVDNKAPCTRCKARGLSCTVNKSLQALLESDASWKERIEERLSRIEQHLDLPSEPLSAEMLESGRQLNGHSDTIDVHTSHESESNPARAALNLSGSLGAFPASSIMDVTFATERNDYASLPDLISCGILSLETGNAHFTYYKDRLDPNIHYILEKDTTLAHVRGRSSFLTAAICTVAAFCTFSGDYQICLKAFKAEVSRRLFSEKLGFDDARALCIGAFWLPDISSALNGLAVRIGTQLDLHRCITKMPHTKIECYERTRLHFLIYLCDHHCSLIYGRPPMTTEFRSLKGPGAFLQSEFSTLSDLNLISQVEFWSLNRRVFDLFGSDIQSTIVSQRYVELDRLSSALDLWYEDGLAVLNLRETSTPNALRTFEFYFHSAKLYLFSHVFRGPSHHESPAMMKGTESMAAYASESALSILRCAMRGEDDYDWLKGQPYYFGTMIAFASVCLIRTTLSAPLSGDPKATEALRYLHRVSEVLKKSSNAERSSHPLFSIARSLEAAISEQQPSTTLPFDQMDSDYGFDLTFDFDLFASDPLNLTFPGAEDNWMLCPEQIPPMEL